MAATRRTCHCPFALRTASMSGPLPRCWPGSSRCPSTITFRITAETAASVYDAAFPGDLCTIR
ncbi:hypothetical protein M5D96_003724 [Drosophila gunungcola]|uniref:Uncharacterized protein n=1 Tax=Drosophila gunungcola TaxID=103775 RepID=A0A9Q0BSD1_9MUSC|nr:hypothetical protein M5D96_003724 [Drosophila gunungcola]